MVNWLKRFFFPIFSNRYAEESVKHGFGNILLTSVLAVAFIFLGIFAGETLPFTAYYNGAGDYREFLYNSLEDISVTVEGSYAEVKTPNGAAIDTVANQTDKDKYSKNGYHLFVDPRNVSSLYDDFYAYCKTADGAEISYEEYLKLEEGERKNYAFGVRYSGKEKTLTAESVAGYRAYLDGLDDKDVTSRLASLEGKDNYNDGVYALYLEKYYPDIYSVAGEKIPTIRNYYFFQTLKTDGRYLCLFGDMAITSFISYNGVLTALGGTYAGVNGFSGQDASAEIDGFISGIYWGNRTTAFLLEFLNGFTVIAVTEFVIVGAMLLYYCICRFRSKGIGQKFANSARVAASYSHTGAFAAALLSLCFGFILNGAAVSVFAFSAYALIMITRTFFLLLNKKTCD